MINISTTEGLGYRFCQDLGTEMPTFNGHFVVNDEDAALCLQMECGMEISAAELRALRTSNSGPRFEIVDDKIVYGVATLVAWGYQLQDEREATAEAE